MYNSSQSLILCVCKLLSCEFNCEWLSMYVFYRSLLASFWRASIEYAKGNDKVSINYGIDGLGYVHLGLSRGRPSAIIADT